MFDFASQLAHHVDEARPLAATETVKDPRMGEERSVRILDSIAHGQQKVKNNPLNY